jgi:hypothetical protein
MVNVVAVQFLDEEVQDEGRISLLTGHSM